ncbi:hypothetical protein RRF68_04945 [Tenacibaculum sp. HL-MS23]|uniref:hypothetical protein n=1 Tax=Tenacibaculum sp. HL-MS23 TaxID=3077734 RepID=UPI0028FC283C|nr:hypothetical protein [Tenacibaculum sp. HL-MS23]WNW02758.1 hypothetical protein RRF68_04945 [Tenacibaculum sp. HL-MS23]
MKKIHFDNLNKNWFLITILILSIIFLLVGIFEFIPFENPKVNKKISGAGFLLQAIYFSRMFWFKNYIQWNNKGAVIRINSFIGKSLSFDNIKTTDFNEKKLTITKVSGKIMTFDLKGIAESDTQKLKEIIVKNTIANTV